MVLLWRSVGPYHLARARAAAERMAARGGRVVVVELCDEEETRDWRIDRADAGVEIVTLAPGSRLTDRSQNLTSMLIATFEQLQPVCVAVAGYDRPEMRAALRWGNETSAVVLMSETKADDRARPWWKRMLIAREVRLAQAALVSGSAAGEYLVSLGMLREKIFRQYGSVDNAYFREHAYERRNGDGRMFLACSRLIESRKNIVRLLRAYSQYRHRVEQPWELVICGDGPDRSMYEAYMREHRIEGITLAGFQQVEPLAGYYAQAGCFVHPAANEAWGLVVNEALASGLPVLVSRRCGCAYDLVHEGVNGYTFDPHEHVELAELMQRISESPAERLRQMGQESLRIVSRYGCEAFAEGLEYAYRATTAVLNESAADSQSALRGSGGHAELEAESSQMMAGERA